MSLGRHQAWLFTVSWPFGLGQHGQIGHQRLSGHPHHAAVVGSWPGHGAAALQRWHVVDTLQPGMLGLPSLVLLVTAGAS